MFHGQELSSSGDLKPLSEEEVARIRASEVIREREKTKRKRRRQEAVEDMSYDEEVAKISQQLQEAESVLERRVVIEGGSADASSEDGSYYPSTDSEFSTPEPPPPTTTTGKGEENDGGAKVPASSPGLLEFGSSPPANLVYSAPSRGQQEDGQQILSDTTPLAIQNQDKSPNLLETGTNSAFKTIKQQHHQKVIVSRRRRSTNQVIPPMKNSPQQPEPQSTPEQQQNKVFVANIDGRQVLLIPTSSASGQKPNQEEPPSATPSKLEQCLRFGSAAAMGNAATTDISVTPAVAAPQVVVSTPPSSASGHTFVLSQPINLNINKPPSSGIVASAAPPPPAIVSSFSAPENVAPVTPAIRKINTIRLVPVASSSSSAAPQPRVVVAQKLTPAPVIQALSPFPQVRLVPQPASTAASLILEAAPAAPPPVIRHHLVGLAPAAVHSS